MANSKNTKKDRDEKKSGDLSELNESYISYGTASKSNSETAGSEFTGKYASSFDEEDEMDHPTSVYASKINKTYGESSKNRTKQQEEAEDDYSYTSQLGNDQRSDEQYPTARRQHRGRTHQLSYDQQFRYQRPSSFQQPYDQPYQQYDNSNDQPSYERGHRQTRFQHQPYGYQPRYESSQQQPQGFNQAYNYGNQFGNQQFVNRGYENHNYNDQSNRLRSSFNTQGFGDSIYRHETFHPERGGSGYAGSTFGGEGNGEFRSNPYDYDHPYGNPEFKTHRQEFRNPSRGYTRNYRLDEEHRNDYQHDEDGIMGFQNEHTDPPFTNDYYSPHRNERGEDLRYDREYSKYERSRYNPQMDFEGRNSGHNFERSYGQFDRYDRKSRSRRNS